MDTVKKERLIKKAKMLARGAAEIGGIVLAARLIMHPIGLAVAAVYVIGVLLATHEDAKERDDV